MRRVGGADESKIGPPSKAEYFQNINQRICHHSRTQHTVFRVECQVHSIRDLFMVFARSSTKQCIDHLFFTPHHCLHLHIHIYAPHDQLGTEENWPTLMNSLVDAPAQVSTAGQTTGVIHRTRDCQLQSIIPQVKLASSRRYCIFCLKFKVENVAPHHPVYTPASMSDCHCHPTTSRPTRASVGRRALTRTQPIGRTLRRLCRRLLLVDPQESVCRRHRAVVHAHTRAATAGTVRRLPSNSADQSIMAPYHTMYSTKSHRS